MGSQSVKAITTLKQRKEYISQLLNDIKAFELMIENDAFEKGIQRIGAEQELCIVNKNYRPSFNALKILDSINDPHFTTELGLFNLEINLDPLQLNDTCFSKLEQNLQKLLNKANSAADSLENDKIILCGILPTLKKKDLVFKNMTPFEHYKTLNNIIKNIKGGDFKMRIRGVDELILNHESILFEACNTSFQVHLQIGLDEIIDKYNWSQAIAGPVLAVMTNSPMLLGKELWSETRIALFRQSIDLRTTSHLLREQKPRVSFGHDWVKDSIVELFTDDISRYSPLVTADFTENAIDQLKSGIKPKLEALNLHNGTLYKWNRLCYGVHKNSAHLRIENRYIPSGPSVKDEIANALFWVGVIQGMPREYKNIWKLMPFDNARGNFIKASRTGIDSYFNWFGNGISAQKLARKILIPMAREGLKKSNINVADIDFYLNIIEKRIENNITGSKWQIRSSRKLKESVSQDETNILLTYYMHKNQQKNMPVYQWKLTEMPKETNINTNDKIYKVMTTEIFVVNENDLVELIEKIMEWKHIHHLPVVNELNKIVGIITKTNLDAFNLGDVSNNLITAKDVMVKNIKTADSEMLISDARELMDKNKIGCLPILEEDELVGILTRSDLEKIDKRNM